MSCYWKAQYYFTSQILHINHFLSHEVLYNFFIIIHPLKCYSDVICNIFTFMYYAKCQVRFFAFFFLLRKFLLLILFKKYIPPFSLFSLKEILVVEPSGLLFFFLFCSYMVFISFAFMFCGRFSQLYLQHFHYLICVYEVVLDLHFQKCQIAQIISVSFKNPLKWKQHVFITQVKKWYVPHHISCLLLIPTLLSLPEVIIILTSNSAD